MVKVEKNRSRNFLCVTTHRKFLLLFSSGEMDWVNQTNKIQERNTGGEQRSDVLHHFNHCSVKVLMSLLIQVMTLDRWLTCTRQRTRWQLAERWGLSVSRSVDVDPSSRGYETDDDLNHNSSSSSRKNGQYVHLVSADIKFHSLFSHMFYLHRPIGARIHTK